MNNKDKDTESSLVNSLHRFEMLIWKQISTLDPNSGLFLYLYLLGLKFLAINHVQQSSENHCFWISVFVTANNGWNSQPDLTRNQNNSILSWSHVHSKAADCISNAFLVLFMLRVNILSYHCSHIKDMATHPCLLAGFEEACPPASVLNRLWDVSVASLGFFCSVPVKKPTGPPIQDGLSASHLEK